MKNTHKTKSQRPATNQQLAKPSVVKSLTQGASSIADFEENILEIDIKKPRTSFNFYIMDMREKHKIKGSITTLTSEFAEKYKALSTSEMLKYEKMADEDKKRYESHMALVKKYVLEKPFKEKATAYSIFIDEKLREARENNVEDLKEVKKKYKYEWENEMTPEEKNVYKEKLEKHFEFYDELKKSNRPANAYALFIKDQLSKARENNESLTIKDVAPIWAKASNAIKERYEVYAQEVAEDAKKHRHIYELAYGIKPKLPISAFRFYYKDALNKGLISGKGALKEARELFTKMKEDEKEPYLKMAKKEKLAFLIKKREYLSQNKKTRTPSAYNLFISDLKGTDPSKFSEQGFFNYAHKKWKTLDNSKKEKYEKQAEKLKKENDREYEEKKSFEKSAPKKPLSAYNLFIRDRLPALKKQYPNKDQTDFFGMIAEEYKNLSNADTNKLQKRADKEKARYEKEKNEYDIQMSQMNVSQLEKIEEDKKERAKSKSKTVKKLNAKSKNKKKDASDEEDYEDEDDDKNKKKRGNSKKGQKKRN